MVIPVEVDVNQLAVLGKKFVWGETKPRCPRCGQPLWWHGFVSAYLDCLAEAVFLRRLFCPYCRSVHRLRPRSHWRRFQSSIKTIEQAVSHRQDQGRWRPDLPRPRQRQWWYRLRRKACVCLGMAFDGSLSEAFMMLVRVGAIAVGSVMQCGNESA